MKRAKTLKHLSMTAAASALLLCGGALSSQQVKAAPVQKPMGIAYVTYSGKVRLMDVNGHYVNQYVPPNSSWKVFEKQMVGGEYAYRIGDKHQWLPIKYAAIN